METKKTREFVIGVLPEGMVTILRTESLKSMETKKTRKPVLANEREARLIFESRGIMLCPVPDSFEI